MSRAPSWPPRTGLCHETLSEALAPGPVNTDALHGTLDWLLPRQGAVGKQLAPGHLADSALVPCAVTST